MKFEEFENTLQDWLDEGRLDEVESLLPLVCEADRAECEELLFTYHALFAGLNSASSVELPPDHVSPATHRKQSPWKEVSLPAIAMSLALCLTIIAAVPGLFSGSKAANSQPSPSLATVPQPAEVVPGPLPQLSSTPQIASREPGLTRFATVSFEPLARSMVSQTDIALKSINRVATDLNPIDHQFSAYQDAAPLLDTLTRGFLPGTRSLGNAFSVLHESTIEPTAPTQEQESSPLSPSSEQNPVVS
ncbi:hypothetical protein C5Y96_04815 [Blastopirellula marina]|uniref:Uncharacterized protein n=1 Tax=Blastopirellula marina TaxID=124 RepID=A0A2S8G439_9BACT|nr:MULTISPECIES: hypothetical protein [Pirellulaceae]PQO39183.1 hypothetical protein C5Y96_04815 [Blastopirellula marina]RCS55491.1 hypothetical protein DTL36_04825 [Bremerella cremea]